MQRPPAATRPAHEKGRAPLGALALLFCLLFAACSGREATAPTAPATPILLPTLMPTPTGAPQQAAPATPTGEPTDTGWRQAAPGVELRRMLAPAGDATAPVSVVRLDPAQVRLQVGYAPDKPLALSAWASGAGAVAAINGGFFDAAGRSVALLVHGGEPVGASYVGRGGMFAVTPEGGVWLRGLADTPYDPAEPVAEGLQGWPMLVRPGGEVAYTYEDGARERRSAIALDAEGRVLLVAASTPALTLRELAEWLAAADLGVVTAMNLDGGSSTGLLVQSDAAPEQIVSFAPLPIVLLVLPR